MTVVAVVPLCSNGDSGERNSPRREERESRGVHLGGGAPETEELRTGHCAPRRDEPTPPSWTGRTAEEGDRLLQLSLRYELTGAGRSKPPPLMARHAAHTHLTINLI